jgi:RNA polymerase sigma-70 factor (ECF subfamily)
MVAQQHAFGRPVQADDLLQMAFASSLDGRSCPANVDVVRFLAEAMRSIADGEVDKARRRVILVPVPRTGVEQDEEVEFPDDCPSVEERMVSDENVAQMRAAVLALFDDDAVVRDMVEGIMADMTAEELRELTGLDQTAYDSKRRLIRRRISAAFPRGLRP